MRGLVALTLFLAPLVGFSQILPTFGDSRTGGSGMQFLKIQYDARSAALAGSVVGISNDASAMFWNPAGITRSDTGRINVMVSHTRYYSNTSGNFAGLVFKPGKFTYMGFHAISLNYGDMQETTEFQPYGTGRNVITSNTLLGFTFARILTENFSFGVNTKWAHEGIGDVRIDNVLFDLGLQYNIGLMYSKFGVSFTNFGVNVAPQGHVTILKMNGEKTISNFSEVSAPSAFRIGGALDPIHNSLHILTVAAQLNHPTDNNETFAIGTEYSYKRFLFGRAGYELASDEKFSFPTLGTGISLKRSFGLIRFDYSFTAKERLGNLHRLTLSACIR